MTPKNTQSRVACLILACVLTFAADAAERFGVVMTQELEHPSNPDRGVGNADLTLDPARTSLHINLVLAYVMGNIIGLHLHEGGEALVLDLLPKLNGNRVDTTIAIDRALGDRIAAQPENFALHVHTDWSELSRRGAMRGTLTPLDREVLMSGELRSASSSAVGAFVLVLDRTELFVELNLGTTASATSAHIHGPGGAVAVDLLAAGGRFAERRLTSRIAVPDAVATALRANPGSFQVDVHSEHVNGSVLRGAPVIGYEYDLPAAARVTGATETWVTDVRIFNPSFDFPTAVLLEFFPSNASGSGNAFASASMTVNVLPRATAILDDVASRMSANGIGALRVTSRWPLAVTSRVFADRRASRGGTIGQFVPATPRPDALRRGVLPQLAYRLPTKARTNIGIFNPNQNTVYVRLAAHKPDPLGPVLTRSIAVAPMAQIQKSIAEFFVSEQINSDDLTVTFDASAPLIVYASVIDAVTSDPIFVPAQRDVGVPQANPR